MSTTIDQSAAAESTQSIFRRILIGIDHSPESLEAARQAATLATGPVTLLAAYERDLTHAIAGAGMAPVPPVMLDEAPVRERAEEALERAKQVLAPTEAVSKIVYGRGWEVLHYEIARTDDTLVAVGSHGTGRAKGILVGVDDSWQGARADAVARELAGRFGAELDRYENVRNPVNSLVEAAIEADLLVVGSRRLHGLKALGSVSERVAHEAQCSVLVVR